MQLSPELYKGYSIRFIKKILGNGKTVVIGKYMHQRKTYQVEGPTKEWVLTKIKKILDTKLPKAATKYRR